MKYPPVSTDAHPEAITKQLFIGQLVGSEFVKKSDQPVDTTLLIDGLAAS